MFRSVHTVTELQNRRSSNWQTLGKQTNLSLQLGSLSVLLCVVKTMQEKQKSGVEPGALPSSLIQTEVLEYQTTMYGVPCSQEVEIGGSLCV